MRHRPALRRALAALVLALAAAPAPALAQAEDEIAFARAFLDRLQIRSIVENREYCGFFGRRADGSMVATRPRRGKAAACSLANPPERLELFASYHTHASFDPGSYNELPSLLDLKTDIESRLPGYLSTPGGRVWYSDHEQREVRQVCGIGCVAQDPSFRPGKFMKIRRRYTLAELERLMGP